MLLCVFGDSEGSDSSCTNKLTDRGNGRPAAPVFCEVKLLFWSMESGGFLVSLSVQFPVGKVCLTARQSCENILNIAYTLKVHYATFLWPVNKQKSS